jgi:DNA-binding response OmpR family regulator
MTTQIKQLITQNVVYLACRFQPPTVEEKDRDMRIGLLEDDPELCAMLKEMLGTGGHAVSVYHDGLDFLTALHLEEPTTLISPFDILLVDLIISGGIDGVQVIHQVRMKYPYLPIVVVSAVAPSHLEAVTRRYPGVRALQKPFKLRQLFAAIEGEESSL